MSATVGFPEPRSLRRSRGRRAILVALFLIAGVAATIAVGTSSGTGGPPSAASQATAATRAFLRRYVAASGQVIRRDQGGDTVSEGQAYALLLSDAVGDRTRFRRVWSWTRSHLQRPNGELAYLASPSGAVQDATPASDADVLTAWALSRYAGPGAAALHAQARRLSGAILGNETVRRGNLLVLAAGPWATGSPASLDPGYWAPTAFEALARFTGDRRWRELAQSASTVTDELTRHGTLLPPDWARVDGSVVSPTPAPNHQAPQVQYGLDAQRLVVWMATSCTAADRALAARWWPIFSPARRSAALALTTEGTVLDEATNALPDVAAAAAAHAAGQGAAVSRLLAQARRVQSTYPTYYGGAWLALGQTLLETGRLGGCDNQGGSS